MVGTTTDPNDNLSDVEKYRTFVHAVQRFVKNEGASFIRPGVECWPEGVETQDEAADHYGEEYAGEILDHWIDVVEERIEEADE